MLDKYSMATIQELESFKLSDAVDFHEELNPRLWDDEKLDPEVRDQLLLIAEDFVEYLGLDNLKVEDVTISGSNAAYSYTPHSDLDLHILVDFNNLPNDPVYQELFTAKKTLYNDAHDITVRGVPVELYVQDTNQVHTSLGEYSVVYDKWIRIPKKRRANFDQAATKLKYEKLGDLIELAIKSRNPKKVKDTIDLVKRYRKAGLEKAGEFGPENLAFKAIRKQGLIQDLYDLKAELHGEKLSIDEASSRDDALIKIKKLLNTAGRTDSEKATIKSIISKMMKQWNIDPEEVGIRRPVDPNKAKMAKDSYEKTMSANWDSFKKGIFAEDIQPKFYKNLSPKQLYNLTKRSTHKHLRGLYHNGDTYWWDASDAIHKQGADQLGIEYDYQQRIEAAIDSISDNYRVGGDDGVPQDIIQKYDIENELVYESIVYHVTPTRNLRSIMKSGLHPKIGDRSSQLDGEVEGIFLFPSLIDVEAAVSSWLGDEFDEDEELSLLAIDITGLEDNIVQGAGYETIANTAISPDRIKVDDSLLLEVSGYIPSTKEKNDLLWEFKKPNINYWVLQESIEEYYKKDGKWFPHRTHSIHQLISKPELRESVQDDVKEFWNQVIRLDGRNKVKLVPGNSISIIQCWTHLYDSIFELRGNLTPKKIVDVFYEDTGAIEYVQFEDGSTFPDKSFLDRNQGGELEGIITTFFSSKNEAEHVLTVLRLALPKGWKLGTTNLNEAKLNEASGYIPSEKEKNDPRFKMALSVDVKPNSIKKNAKAFGFKTSRAGIPPQARADGKIAEDLMREWKSFLAEDEQQELFPGYDEKHRQERLNAWLGKSHAMAGKKPKVLYHATTKDFDQFRVQNQGWVSGSLIGNVQIDRTGIFLAENPKFAEEFIKNTGSGPEWKENAVIIPVYLSAQYPFSLLDNSLLPMLSDEALVEKFNEHDIDLKSIYHHYYEDKRWELFDGPEGQDFVQNLKRLGYDSAVMQEEAQSHGGSETVWVAFNSAQVKAITNRGSFSPDDPRMMRENG
jgi:hypothetical protein